MMIRESQYDMTNLEEDDRDALVKYYENLVLEVQKKMFDTFGGKLVIMEFEDSPFNMFSASLEGGSHIQFTFCRHASVYSKYYDLPLMIWFHSEPEKDDKIANDMISYLEDKIVDMDNKYEEISNL